MNRCADIRRRSDGRFSPRRDRRPFSCFPNRRDSRAAGVRRRIFPWGRTFEDTLAKLKEQTLTDPNIFYLDLIGTVELDGVNFVGGTLFFDGSMRIRDNQRIDQWDGLQDWRIVDIESRYMEINAYYVDMIWAKMKPGMPTALCTHHVPHVRLNGHEPSHYSFYTGMKDLVHELPFDPMFNNYLICGHTHRRVIGEVVPGFMGVNVGSDYDDLKTFVLDV